MMGPRQEAQSALFYEFCLEITFLQITCCVQLIVLSIFLTCGATLHRLTVPQAVHPLTLS